MINYLSFDSELFGYHVGETLISSDWDETVFLEKAKRYELVYLFSNTKIEMQNPAIQFIETKVFFEKELIDSFQVKSVQPYFEGGLARQVVDLALQSGTHSRFKLDPGFVGGEFEKLYRKWIQTAFEKNIILIYTDANGMITVNKNKPTATIGLFAVDSKHQRKGLGADLLVAAESYAINNGAKSLRITTQASNEQACRFYTKMGYEVEAVSYVYHYWNR